MALNEKELLEKVNSIFVVRFFAYFYPRFSEALFLLISMVWLNCIVEFHWNRETSDDLNLSIYNIPLNKFRELSWFKIYTIYSSIKTMSSLPTLFWHDLDFGHRN
jgi:hypothetical protein